MPSIHHYFLEDSASSTLIFLHQLPEVLIPHWCCCPAADRSSRLHTALEPLFNAVCLHITSASLQYIVSWASPELSLNFCCKLSLTFFVRNSSRLLYTFFTHVVCSRVLRWWLEPSYTFHVRTAGRTVSWQSSYLASLGMSSLLLPVFL